MAQESDEIRELLGQGRFADAARLYQQRHGVSLEEALDAVQRLSPPSGSPSPSSIPGLDAAGRAEVEGFLRAGQKILAIKALRDRTSLGLREAKDIVDRWGGEVGAPPVKSGCFIATVTYGDSAAPELAALRRYRDRVLRRSPCGRVF